jgi:hypothetical protein
VNKKTVALILAAIFFGTSFIGGCAVVDSHAGTPAPDSGSGQSVTDTPATMALSGAQVSELSLSQLTADFAADPVKAEAEYGGKTYLFRNVYVDDVSSLFKPTNPDTFVMNGKVKFEPRYSSSLSDVPIDSVVDVEGTVWRIQSSFLVIRDCVYTVVDATNGWERPDFQFTFA